MKVVKIAELRTRLSQLLREVRAGNVLTVVDRNAPVARLVPVNDGDDVVISRPAPDALPLWKIKLPALTRTGVDVVALLSADRRRRG